MQILATVSIHHGTLAGAQISELSEKAQHFAVLIMEARISYIPAPAPLPAINPCLTNEKSNTTNKWHVELQHE